MDIPAKACAPPVPRAPRHSRGRKTTAGVGPGST
jgi:hypothetical protein